MNDNTQDTPADEPEALGGAAALDALEREANALEGAHEQAAATAEAEQQQAQAASTAEELRGALELARMMAAPAFAWWPDFGACWSDRQLHAISESGAAVMLKHGWSMGELLSKWGPYFALAGATIPPALATYGAIQHRKEVEQAQRRQVKPGDHAGALPAPPDTSGQGVRA